MVGGPVRLQGAALVMLSKYTHCRIFSEMFTISKVTC